MDGGARIAQRFQRVATGIDVAPLLARINAQPDLWKQITARQDAPGSPHHDTECIFLRWAADRTAEAAFYELESIDYPAAEALMPEIAIVIIQALQAIGISVDHDPRDIGKVIITKLPPGGSIDEHFDEGPYADKYDRFHLCLQQSGSTFTVDNANFTATAGELWWFNHKRRHSVSNNGHVDRIHLILDVVAPAYRAMRGIYCQQERFVDVFAEAEPLLVKHWQEVAHYQDIPLDVDCNAYATAESQGKLRIYTARDCGTLIGYAAFFVSFNPHYASSLQAMQDVIYLDPAHRGGRTGIKLIKHAEAALKAEGVQVIYHHVKAAHPLLGKILEHMHYTAVDTIYGKRLDKETT
jgi:L-amino acid N-acyltransferase YncA